MKRFKLKADIDFYAEDIDDAFYKRLPTNYDNKGLQ